MIGGTVRVVSTTRRVPALTLNGRYQVFIRQGKEFILDWHGGYVPVKQAHEVGIILERLHG